MARHSINSVKNVVKVGDTMNDMVEGKNAGCELVIGVLTGVGKKELCYKADLVIENISELMNL